MVIKKTVALLKLPIRDKYRKNIFAKSIKLNNNNL